MEVKLMEWRYWMMAASVITLIMACLPSFWVKARLHGEVLDRGPQMGVLIGVTSLVVLWVLLMIPATMLWGFCHLVVALAP